MAKLNNLTDMELVHLLQKGDKNAFAEIFERYNALLFAHAYKKLQEKEAAKDLIQDVFATFWLKRETIQIKETLTGYLYSAVRNKFYDLLSRKQLENEYIISLKHFFNNETAIPDHLIREKQLSEIIECEIQSLPPRMRAIFEMSRKQHLSHKKIAIELEISQYTVADQIKKALRILKPRLLTIFIFLVLHL